MGKEECLDCCMVQVTQSILIHTEVKKVKSTLEVVNDGKIKQLDCVLDGLTIYSIFEKVTSVSGDA